MSAELEAKVTLVNNKIRFAGTTKDNPEIIIDYSPPLGDGEGYTSLELLLISLASCGSSTIVSILRKMQKEIRAFTVNVKGIRRDEHPTVFESIHLEFIFNSPDAKPENLKLAIEKSEEKYCPVWAMLKGNTSITYGYKIINE
jgi:putative redox protein